MLKKINLIKLIIILSIILSSTFIIQGNIEKVSAGYTCCHDNDPLQCNGCKNDGGESKQCGSPNCNAPGCEQCCNFFNTAIGCNPDPPPPQCDPNSNCSSCTPSIGPGTITCAPGLSCQNSRTCCTSANTSSPINQTPTDNALLDTVSVTVTWAPPSNWGFDCSGGAHQYVLWLSTDAVTYIQVSGVMPETTTSFQLPTLIRDTTYYWYVTGNNGYSSANSTPTSFTIAAPPVLYSGGLINSTDVCGNGISGIAAPEQTGTSNPILFSGDFYDKNFSIRTPIEIRLAFVPANNATSPFNDNHDYEYGDRIQALVAKSKSIEIGISFETKKMYLLDSVNGWFDSGVSFGDGTNQAGTGTGIGFGSTTNVSKDNKGGVYSRILTRFNKTFTSGRYNIYEQFLTKTASGEVLSSYAGITRDDNTVLGDQVYKRVNATPTSQTWGVDLTPPSVPVGQVTYNNDGSFSIVDKITDNNVNDSGIKDTDITGTIYSNKNGSRVAQILGSNTVLINNGQSLPTTPAGSSFQVSNSNNGTISKNYPINSKLFDLTKNLKDSFTVLLNAKDQACNKTGPQQTTIGQPFPWTTSINGSISTQSGIPDLEFPANYNPIPPVLNLTPPQVPYFSTYTSINQSLTVPDQISAQKEEILSNPIYNNLAKLPPDGTNSWYNYFQTIVKKNYSKSFLNFNSTGSNTISSFIPSSVANSTQIIVAQANSDIIIRPDTICDVTAVIFISGKLTIYPNFQISGNGNGCIFISSDDILIGNHSLSNVALGSQASAQYETINAQFVTDKEFVTYPTYTDPFYNKKGVGLYINGGIIANQFVLQRDLNYIGNAGQPAHIFEFDPRYRDIFGDLFAITKYSVREVAN